MRIQTRMLLGYLVVVVLAALLGVGTFGYVRRAMEETLHASLNATSSRMSQQLDNLVRPMEYTSLHLLSNRRFLEAAEDLIGINRAQPENQALINQAEKEIYSVMMSYSLHKYFHRVSVFNSKNDFFSSNYILPVPSRGYSQAIEQLQWLPLLRESKGRVVLLPPYDDPWDGSSPANRVFGLARAIGSNPDTGYIEVQQPYRELEEVFAFVHDAGTSACAVTREGAVLYDAGYSEELLTYYLSIMQDMQPESTSFQPVTNPYTGADEVFSNVLSEQTGVRILLIQDQRVLMQPLTRLGTQILTLYLVVVLVSCLFFLLQSRQIAAPLRKLTREMEATRLENLPTGSVIETHNNEITSLSHAFLDLKERLAELIQRELALQSLHLQACFDALQAKINPHFLYNTLGLISNRAAIQGDREIVKICGAIASLLRYSVNTTVRRVTLAEELLHLQDYLFLMKERYEKQIEFTVEVDDRMMDIAIPKMVLQPLVENAVSHGFAALEGTMRIRMTGQWQEEQWMLVIADNGTGFAPDAYKRVVEQLRKIDEDPDILRQSGGELGGLGIANIYARLRLFSDNAICLRLENNPEGGAAVIMVGQKNASKGGGIHETKNTAG